MLSLDLEKKLSHYHRIWLGYSGGLDSTVLLHVLASHPKLASKVEALHVHHGLSPFADNWQKHCQKFCDALSIPLRVHHVTISGTANIEAKAREERYHFFASLVQAEDVLLLAHHADDQAETLLLHLVRGTGLDGLAGMPKERSLAAGTLLRPFLEHSRDELALYAKAHQLTWIDDESNQNTAYSRNYLRLEIIPQIKKRWPHFIKHVACSARHCREATEHLDTLAAIDAGTLDLGGSTLPLASLNHLSSKRLAHVIRIWLKKNALQVPSVEAFQHLMLDVVEARVDAMPVLKCGSYSIRRYHNVLYILKDTGLPHYTIWTHFPEPLRINERCFLHVEEVQTGLWIPSKAQLTIRYRQGGELIYWHGQHKSLKKLFQQWNIPPWQRAHIPLIFLDEELVMVVGYAIHDHYIHEDGKDTYNIYLSEYLDI